jgi:hypothetical protein
MNINSLKYNEYNETLIEIKDTLLQKLNIYSKRLKRYRCPQKRRRVHNSIIYRKILIICTSN